MVPLSLSCLASVHRGQISLSFSTALDGNLRGTRKLSLLCLITDDKLNPSTHRSLRKTPPRPACPPPKPRPPPSPPPLPLGPLFLSRWPRSLSGRPTSTRPSPFPSRARSRRPSGRATTCKPRQRPLSYGLCSSSATDCSSSRWPAQGYVERSLSTSTSPCLPECGGWESDGGRFLAWPVPDKTRLTAPHSLSFPAIPCDSSF